jgi:pilus assembly protein Flp/PilA
LWLSPEVQLFEEVRKVPLLPGEEGQGLVEYALILVLVAIVVIAVYILLEPAIGDIFNELKEIVGR